MTARGRKRAVEIKESVMLRTGILSAILMLSTTMTFADESEYIVNFDLIVRKPADGEIIYSHRLQGINFLNGKPFHGEDLGEIDYFLTITDADDGKGKLTIEFYQYETRKKESDVVAELIDEISFYFGGPTTFESGNDEFSVDFAFSVIQR